MTIAPDILRHYPDLNPAQREIVGHLDGPLLVIAGPGSGKTYSMVLRALNLLLLEKAPPKEIVLCTFTHKAAFEMRDRLAAAARKVRYEGDLSEMTISTIHGYCNQALTRHRHRAKLGHNYETLDELTQLLFIFEHFDEIVGPPENNLFLTRWGTRWTAIEGARGYFDKITEERVDPQSLARSGDPFRSAIGAACQRQLCSYAHILERRRGRHADRLILYWTSEVRKEDALMSLPYDPERVDEAGRCFDETVRRIQAGEFSVTAPPEAAICRECDLRTLCRAEGIIGESEALK